MTTWPTRAEWMAEPLYDDAPLELSLAELATPDEVAAIIATLSAEWCGLGRAVCERRGEAKAEVRYHRRRLRSALKELEAGQVPPGYVLPHHPGLADLHRRQRARREAAYNEANRRHREYRATEPAWQAELRRRASVEAYQATSPTRSA